MSDRLPFLFGMSEFTTKPWSFERDVEEYAALGVDTIEVCEVKLPSGPIDRQLASIGEHGLRVSSVQPVVRTLFPSASQPEPTSITDRMARFRKTIERFGDAAAGVPFVTNTGNPPDGDVERVLKTAVTEYRRLADIAAERGARVALEPLNPSIVNVETAIWELEQGMRVVAAVDRPNFGLCVDFWNIWQNQRVAEAIEACGDRIFIVQVSDWRTPRSYQDRLIPGRGEIPIASLLRATHAAGYRGAYEVEIFSGDVADSLWEGDLRQVIVASREGLARAWQEAFPS